MPKFVDRQEDLADLDRLAGRGRAQFIVVPDKGEGWTVHYALFARTGFTEATVAEASKIGALLIDLETMGHDLGAS